MIHYHGTPCAGNSFDGTAVDAARFIARRHVLIPFGRADNIGEAAEVCQSFVLDNGAFSAWRKGHPITNWSSYYDCVGLWRRHPSFDWAIIPDVIDGSESDNDILLAEWPWERAFGVPVWHLHESFERLARLVRDWPRVALGSSGEWSSPGAKSWWRRMAEAMDIACDEHGRPRAKLHGLRMLDPAIFHRLPLASADSTNAVRNAASTGRFGMYRPPAASARMAIIADRIEAHQSAAVWRRSKQQVLCFDDITTHEGSSNE